MNYEALFATVSVYVGTLLATGIWFYFKGYRDSKKETLEDFLKKESEDGKRRSDDEG